MLPTSTGVEGLDLLESHLILANVVLRLPSPLASFVMLQRRQPALPTRFELPDGSRSPRGLGVRVGAADRENAGRANPIAPAGPLAPSDHPGGHHENAFHRRLGASSPGVSPRFHPDRIAGRHRDHRRADRAAAAGRAGGARGGAAVAMHQQPQADRPGPAQLREQRGRVPARRQVDVLRHQPARIPSSSTASACCPGSSPILEEMPAYNAINFSLDYNHLSGANFTAYSTVISAFLCPSANREPSGGRDADRPE